MIGGATRGEIALLYACAFCGAIFLFLTIAVLDGTLSFSCLRYHMSSEGIRCIEGGFLWMRPW